MIEIPQNQTIIVIAGPTATGKSSVAVEVAFELNGVVVNADSRQVYQEMTVGTASPQPVVKRKDKVTQIDSVKHSLYNFIAPSRQYSIADYQSDVETLLNKQFSKTDYVVLVGGSGLYIDSVVYNYNLIKGEDIDEDRRKELSEKPLSVLQEMVGDKKLSELNNSDRNNPRRLIRIIEREENTSSNKESKKGPPLKHRYFYIDRPQRELEARVIRRVEEMLSQGLVEENKELLLDGYTYSDPGLNSIGYKEFNGYFEKNKPLEKVKEEIVRNTLQYIKKQRTWFARNRKKVEVNSPKELLSSI